MVMMMMVEQLTVEIVEKNCKVGTLTSVSWVEWCAKLCVKMSVDCQTVHCVVGSHWVSKAVG